MFMFEKLASVIETYTSDIFYLWQINDRSLLIDSSQRDRIIAMYIPEHFQPIIIDCNG